MIFHLPYAYQGRRMMLDIWLEWIKENNLISKLEDEIGLMNNSEFKNWRKAASKSVMYQNFIENKIKDGEMASSYIGNMYTASIFMSLISLLYCAFDKKREIKGDNVGFLSYGSGSKSKIFQGKFYSKWKQKVTNLHVMKDINSRTIIDFHSYEKLHNGALKVPIVNNENIILKSIDESENKEGFRHYIKN